MKVKFTTNIDEILLKDIKVKAIEENTSVNLIIESLLKNYLNKKEETEMKLEKMVEVDYRPETKIELKEGMQILDKDGYGYEIVSIKEQDDGSFLVGGFYGDIKEDVDHYEFEQILGESPMHRTCGLSQGCFWTDWERGHVF